MMRCFVAILLPAICVAFLGCAGGEPPVQTRAPVAAEPTERSAEPNIAGVQEPAQSAAQTGPDAGTGRKPTRTESVDETETAVETAPDAGAGLKPAPTAADSVPVEVNVPPVQSEVVPDSNDSAGPREGREPNAESSSADSPGAPVSPPEVSSQPSTSSPPGKDAPGSSFHDQYAAILAAYVRDDGLVNYGDLRRRRLEFKPVLTTLDELDPNVYQGWSRQEKLAFWINAYNLKVLDIIARNYPIESSWWLRLTWPPSDIRHIKGIWTDYRFIVMDEEFTLAEVEQRFFRKTFGDPRVWLALLYAGQSGPPLDVRPYRGEDLDRRLDEQVKRFLAGPQGLQIDRRNGVVRLSALFKPNWHGREFVARYGTDKKFKAHGAETRAVLNFLTNHLPREDVEFLEVENYALEYLNFDWRLNDTAKGY